MSSWPCRPAACPARALTRRPTPTSGQWLPGGGEGAGGRAAGGRGRTLGWVASGDKARGQGSVGGSVTEKNRGTSEQGARRKVQAKKGGHQCSEKLHVATTPSKVRGGPCGGPCSGWMSQCLPRPPTMTRCRNHPRRPSQELNGPSAGGDVRVWQGAGTQRQTRPAGAVSSNPCPGDHALR